MQWRDDTTLPSRGLCVLMTARGQNEKVSQRAFLDRCTPESGRSFERGERQLRASTGSVNLHSTIASAHRRTLHVSANGQRACEELLQLSDGRIEVEWTDVTDNQLPNACVLGDATDDRRRCV